MLYIVRSLLRMSLLLTLTDSTDMTRLYVSVVVSLATPLPRCHSVATCGRSHLCFRGAQASGRVLTSVRRTWLGASELQPNKYVPHTPHACASSLSQLGALPACVKPTGDITAMTVCTCLWHPSSPALGHQVPVTNSHLIVKGISQHIHNK